MGIRVGIDTGGTFTDLIAVDDRTGEWYLAKVPSNPREPVAAIAAAVQQAQFDPADVDFIVVGTTIGINAVLTRTGARVRFLTTEGFADIPQIQRINRKHHYDYHWRKPEPLAARRDCIGIPERVDEEGNVVLALDPADVQAAIADLGSNPGDPTAVAVCFLFSYANPANERAAREAIQAVAPGLPVSLSHEIAPIWREYERGLAAMLDAYLKPALDGYVAGVSEAFASQGVEARWSLLKSNGGHAVAEKASDRPAHVLLSGIAGGAIGGAYFARHHGADRAMVVDMGGTSCDVCLIVDGEPLYSSEFEIEFGLPVSVPTVNTKTIGAGGGSIGWVDPGGFLQVGPQSAGADPGPACYDNGGSEPTVTDANLVLGRLNPDFFLGGNLHLNAQSSGAALRTIGDRLDMDEVEVASAMIRIANENMANAIRIVTVEQGIDPRDFAIVAMGGAGPTHAAEIADAIGIERVIVPPNPGLSSAFGALAADVRVDEVRSVSLKSTTTSGPEIEAMFVELERVAMLNFEAQRPGDDEPHVERTISMRYEGQNYEQEVTAPNGELGAAELDAIVERYHDLHDEFYGYRFEGVPIEMVRMAVTVTGADTNLPEPRLDAQRVRETVVAEEQTLDVYFDDGGFQPTPMVDRRKLGEGTREGPMIVQSMDTTLVVPPGWTVQSDAGGSVELRRTGGGDRLAAAAGGAAADESN